MLGKRKRPTQVVDRDSENIIKPITNNGTKTRARPEQPPNQPDQLSQSHETKASLRRFQEYFEREFEPLGEIEGSGDGDVGILDDEEDEDEGTDDEEGWGGLSDEDPNSDSDLGVEMKTLRDPVVEVVEVVNYDTSRSVRETDDGQQAKKFMGAKPPEYNDGESSTTPTQRPIPKTSQDTDPSDAINLKHDIELQRLLRESHLLSPSTGLAHTKASNRHKATDLRLQALGAKTSLFGGEKMPPSHRRGIVARAQEREVKRRREASKNGIVLEKENRGTGVSGEKMKKRERGIGGPAVGKFAGGTLTLSKSDIRDIQGPTTGGRGKGKGKTGRTGRR